MIKPESNAPASMKPWVRVTDNQITKLQTKVAKLESLLNAGSSTIDYQQNQSLSNTFSFTPLDDGSTVTNARAMNFSEAVTAGNDVSIAGSLIVGDPSRQDYDPTTGEAIGSIPNLEVISGQLEVNPVTEVEYYTTGQMNMTDTSLNVDGYGLIHGDGLQITLANDGQAERQNIAILGATGTGTAETFQIENNASNVAIYTAGKYVDITGVEPAGYNGTNLLITSVNTGVSPMTFTVSGTESAAYVGGGYVTINQANSIYEGKLTVQGPAPDYTGVTVSQAGVFVGSNGGDPSVSDVVLDSTGLTAPSAFIDQAVINGTRLFISSTEPTAVNDGDIWIDKSGIFTQGTSYVLPTANSTTLGGVELFSDTVQSVGANAVSATAGRTYGAQLNASNQLVINVPWTDTVYTLPKATATTLGGVELFDATVQTVAANAVSTTANRTYGAQLNAADQLVVNVPWTDTVYTLPKATASALGGVELFDATVQTVAANAVTTTANRTYGIQMNAADQLVVNVPWTDNIGYLGSTQIGGASGAVTSITGFNGFTAVAGTTLTIASTASTGVSGNVILQSGDTTSANQNTGQLTLLTGTPTTTGGSSGAISILTGRGGTTAGASGSVYLNVGSLQGSGATGGIGIGNATLANTAAPSAINIGTATVPINITGATTITASGTSSGAGASHSITGGSTSAASANGGSITITGGASTNTGTITTGGSINITAGAGNSTQGAGGSVTINAGTGSVANGNGSISIGTGVGTDSVTIGKTGGSTTLAGTLTAVPTLPSTAQQLFLASPTTGSGTPAFRYISTSDFTQAGSPSVGQALVAAPVVGGWGWGGPYLSINGGSLSGGLTLAAPTSTLSSMTLTTGTQPTTASQAFGQISAGAESVGLGTTKTTGAGPGFGIIQAPQMVFSLADAPVAANSTTGVAAFAAANDTLSSLEANKLYRFSGKYYVTYTAGGTAAALRLLFAFANAPQAIKYNFRTVKSTSATAMDQVGIGTVATGVNVSTSTQTSGTFTVEFDGYFTSNATTGGTLIPQIAASATTSGGTFFVTTGSWFQVQKIGTATQTLIAGNWS